MSNPVITRPAPLPKPSVAEIAAMERTSHSGGSSSRMIETDTGNSE